MKMARPMIWILIGIVILCGVLWGPIVSNVEQAKYQVIEKDGDFEIRDYSPVIVAETIVSGDRDVAINQGFRTIADYIFGNNMTSQKVAMTAPVIQQSGEKIAMTAPVIQQGKGELWTVRFVMPSSYSIKTLPKPTNQNVMLKEVAAKRFAVVRFSGLAGKESLSKHCAELQAFVKSKKLKTISAPLYAFFNPPWTLPFLRRNEVMLELSQ